MYGNGLRQQLVYRLHQALCSASRTADKQNTQNNFTPYCRIDSKARRKLFSSVYGINVQNLCINTLLKATDTNTSAEHRTTNITKQLTGMINQPERPDPHISHTYFWIGWELRTEAWAEQVLLRCTCSN